MSKQFVRALLFLLLTAYLYIVSAQQAILSNEVLLEQYKRAQVYYDKATALSKLESYGPKEEALEQAWNKKALEGFTSIYSVFKKEYALYDSLRFYTSFKIGELHHYFENFSAAVNFYREAIAIKQKSKLPDSLLFKPYLYAGIIFYNQNKFDTAVQFFKNAENIQANYSNELAEAERLYNILGVLFYERGNYKQAQNYFRKALVL
ncbi:MAG TPA: tetratricopeptide repeat protein, partial [Flavisolibacter sp.]